MKQDMCLRRYVKIGYNFEEVKSFLKNIRLKNKQQNLGTAGSHEKGSFDSLFSEKINLSSQVLPCLPSLNYFKQIQNTEFKISECMLVNFEFLILIWDFEF